MRALDTNVLVHAEILTSPFHSVARDLLYHLANGHAPWAIPWPYAYEFLRVVTHPRVYHPPMSKTAAIDDLVRAIPEIVEYEVEIRRLEQMDDLLLKLEIEAGAVFADVERAVAAGARSALNIRVDVVEALRGSLPRYELKARRYKRV